MLVLTREINQSILIGDNIKVAVIKLSDGRVKLGIDAPREIQVDREEVRDRPLPEVKA